MSAAPRGLLPTKLHPRPTRPRTVDRPRLVAQLERCTQLPLTVVSGPAGAGKSTAVVAWLEQTRLPVAWLSLDPADDSPGRFFAYVLAALGTVDAGLGSDASAWLDAPDPEDLDDLEALLADEIVIPLAERREPLVLVLDDLQVITNPSIHAALAWLLDHAPACLRLLISTRTEAPLPLARLRAQGQLGELGVDELRFRLDESHRFYAEVMELELSDERVEALDQRTEGWPAGAQLAALSLRGVGEAELPRGDDRLFADYLLSEVFNGLSPGLRELLVATSIVERVCAPLAEALSPRGSNSSGDDSARALLTEVERENLFLLPLDVHRRWFRYHHLFRDFLRERAAARGPAWLAERHRQAATWLATRDLRDEAFAHAVASGDDALIIALFEGWASETLMRNQIGGVRRWLSAVPGPLREREAVFWFLEGWCDIVVGQLRTGMTKLERSRAASAAGHGSAHVDQLELWLGPSLRVAALLRAGRYDEALALSRQARGSSADPGELTGDLVAGALLMHEGLVHLERGELDQARPVLERAVALVHVSKGFAVVALAHQAQLERRSGQLDAAERCARRALRFAEQSETADLAGGGLARVELAWVALERGESAVALSEVEAGLERLRLLHDVAYLAHGTELLARAKLANDQREDALEVIDEALELLENTDMQPAIERMVELRRELGTRRAPPRPLASEPATEPERPGAVEALTPRETEVLELVATGLSNREIARRLCVSVGTVKTHVHRLLAKLGASNRTRAVHQARRLGLIEAGLSSSE